MTLWGISPALLPGWMLHNLKFAARIFDVIEPFTVFCVAPRSFELLLNLEVDEKYFGKCRDEDNLHWLIDSDWHGVVFINVFDITCQLLWNKGDNMITLFTIVTLKLMFSFRIYLNTFITNEPRFVWKIGPGSLNVQEDNMGELVIRFRKTRCQMKDMDIVFPGAYAIIFCSWSGLGTAVCQS